MIISRRVFFFNADNVPKQILKRAIQIADVKTKIKVEGRVFFISLKTGLFVLKETPISPFNNLFIYLKYCSAIGLS